MRLLRERDDLRVVSVREPRVLDSPAWTGGPHRERVDYRTDGYEIARGPGLRRSSVTVARVLTHTDPERLSAVHRYHILDAPADGSFDSVARVAAQVFGTPIATVTIVDVDRVWFAACHGLSGVTQIGTEPGLCASAVLQDGVYVVNDGAVDPRTLDHPLVRGDLGLRFYAAAPITTGDGHRLGTVNVIDRDPREVTDTQAATLTALAGIVAEQLELRLAAIQAVRAERGLDQVPGPRSTASAKLAGQLRHLAANHLDGEHPQVCGLGLSGPCDEPVEVKVADPWGDSAWACIRHAEDIVINERSTFIADEKLNGLERYLRRRST